MSKFMLPGSERKPLAGATIAGPANPKELLQATLVRRHNSVAGLENRMDRPRNNDYPSAPLTREEFVGLFGDRREDREKTYGTRMPWMVA